jgi:hypothetical protein
MSIKYQITKFAGVVVVTTIFSTHVLPLEGDEKDYLFHEHAPREIFVIPNPAFDTNAASTSFYAK